MHQSFSTNAESITHDSDIRKLRFVARHVTDGAETLFPNTDPTTLLLANAAIQDFPAFTEPYEIRNRNKATFNLQLVKPPTTFSYADGNPSTGESLISSAFQYNTADWGFTHDTQTVDATPAFLLLDPADIPGSPEDYIDRLTITVDIPFSGEPYIGESVTMDIIDPSNGTIIRSIDLTTAGTYETLAGYALPVSNRQLIARVTTSAVAGLDNFAAGHCNVSRHSYGYAHSKVYFAPASQWQVLPGNSGSSVIHFGNIPTGGKLTRVRAVIDKAFAATVGASMSMDVQANGNTLMTFAPNNPGPGVQMVFDSGPVDFVVPFFAGPPPWFTAKLTMDEPLANLDLGGLITFFYEYEVQTGSTPFAWTAGDTLTVLAFASIDGLQYTPISMARHDWSNTPFVDIIKFNPLNIPDDFDPTGGYPPGVPAIDGIAFRNSTMLFMSDFDNASTWNYIRFLIAWNPWGGEGGSHNDNVQLEITANAREL